MKDYGLNDFEDEFGSMDLNPKNLLGTKDKLTEHIGDKAGLEMDAVVLERGTVEVLSKSLDDTGIGDPLDLAEEMDIEQIIKWFIAIFNEIEITDNLSIERNDE